MDTSKENLYIDYEASSKDLININSQNQGGSDVCNLRLGPVLTSLLFLFRVLEGHPTRKNGRKA